MISDQIHNAGTCIEIKWTWICNKCDQISTPGIYEHNSSPVTFPLTSSSPHQSGWPYRGVPFFTVSNSVQKVQENIILQQVRDTHIHRHTMGSLLFLSHPTITTSQFKPLAVLILQSKCSWSGTIKTLQLYARPKIILITVQRGSLVFC